MNKKQVKSYLYKSVMQQIELKKRTRETSKYLNKAIKSEKKFLKGLPEEKTKEYYDFSFDEMMYSGSETCDEIKFTINFIIDLFSSIN